MADLSKVVPHETILEILHPGTKRPIGVRVGLRSFEDDALKKMKRQINDSRLRLAQRGKNFDTAQEEANNNLLAFAAMTFWQWGKDADGEQATFGDNAPTFKQEMVEKVFDALPWFRDQITSKMLETESFYQASN